MSMFESLEQMVVQTAAAVRPPERLNVPQAAAKYRWINNPGAYVGQFDPDIAPYANEPMECLTSLSYTGLIFCGPAQASKTDPCLNWITHTALCDPADMMMIHPSQTAARDFAMRRLDRLWRDNPALAATILPGRQHQNTFDVRFLSGWLLTLSWPTINELSGKPIRHLWLTDYDRMPESINGEGSAFDLARKRATTFGRFGMTVAESSPGFEVTNPKWLARTKHEAPPTQGILALYNRGDRRRFYWPCPHCRTPFEPEFRLLVYPDSGDALDAAEQAELACPHCGGIIKHDGDPTAGIPGKNGLNKRGRWLKEGQKMDAQGNVRGAGLRSEIASFWLKGPCAAMATWKDLVYRYLQAREEYEQTGSVEAWKTTVNVDQGEPFLGPEVSDGLLPERIKAMAEEMGDRVVPDDVRFLIATIDVQKSKFVVQVHGHGYQDDVWFIDRFDVKKSQREDEDGERYLVSPGSYLEDWRELIDNVILRSYPLASDPERRMAIKMTACDSGGRAGVTTNAYAFWRLLRDDPDIGGNLHRRFVLVKGADRIGAPRVQIVHPDSPRKDRFANARGEIPVLLINTNTLKDQMAHILGRLEKYPGRCRFPDWMPDQFYEELCVEHRGPKGWENPRKLRNESWDLWCYDMALCLHQEIRLEKIDWEHPPSWAADQSINTLVFQESGERPFASKSEGGYDLKTLGDILA